MFSGELRTLPNKIKQNNSTFPDHFLTYWNKFLSKILPRHTNQSIYELNITFPQVLHNIIFSTNLSNYKLKIKNSIFLRNIMIDRVHTSYIWLAACWFLALALLNTSILWMFETSPISYLNHFLIVSFAWCMYLTSL